MRTERRKGNRGRRRRRMSRAWVPRCSSLWSQNGSCPLLNFPWIYPGHTQWASTHKHPSSSHTLQPLLFTEEQPLSPCSLPCPDSASSFLFLWASPELGTDSSPAPKPLSIVVESPKHRNHPVEEEMQATRGIGSPWRMISCPRPFWVVIFEDVKLIQKKLWDPCCRPLLHVANSAVLCAVLSCSVMSDYATKS